MGGAMGGGDTGSSHQTTTVQLPQFIQDQAQKNLGLANKIAGQPYVPYKGKTVAPLSQEFYQAQGMLPGLDDYFGNYGGATDTFNRLTGFDARDVNAPSVTAGMLRDTDLNPYLNPYIENVENRAIDAAERSGQHAQNKIQSDASKGGAAFGSRQALQQAVQGAETTRGIGDMSAQLRMMGFDKATANAMADIDRKLKADTQTGMWNIEGQKANQASDIAGAQIQSNAATGLADTAGKAQDAMMKQIMAYLGIGGMQQEQTQREYDDKKSRWDEKKNHPMEMLNMLLAATGMTPYGKTEITDKESETQGGMDIASILGSALKFGAMLPSDRSLKTDITKLSDDSELGVPLYAYRYKGDPKSYPKVVGPMAQDVEKKHPKAVRKIGGKRVIDLSRLAADI